MRKKLISILVIASMLTLCACSGNKPEDSSSSKTSDTKKQEASKDTGSSAKLPTTDPSGAKISIPEKIDSIVVLSPALAEIVTALDMGDKVTGYDGYSTGVEGLPKDAVVFENISEPDMEQLAALSPDILLITEETFYDKDSALQSLIDGGTCVIRIPTSDSIAGIKSNIEFLASALGASEAGDALLKDFDAQLKELTDIAAGIPKEEHKRVYFEVAPAPNMYSFGSGVFLNEIIELIGAENILADQSGWITVEGETIVEANPDVIFTNVDYQENSMEEILGRDGWADISAVANKNVYSIDSNSSSHSNHTIIKAMRQMAESLYPDYYKAE